MPAQNGVVRFGSFEADLCAGELRRNGIRLKLQSQPFRVLALLLQRPGQILTREELQRELWPAGTFLDYEQGSATKAQKHGGAVSAGPDGPPRGNCARRPLTSARGKDSGPRSATRCRGPAPAMPNRGA